eukprot:CFRG2132T1
MLTTISRIVTLATLVALIVEAGVVRRKEVQTLPQGTSWTLKAWGPKDTTKGHMIDIDLQTSTKSDVQKLRDAGRYVVCYISAGTAETWRPDYEELKPYTSVKSQYDRERWMDISKWQDWKHIMKKRFDMARDFGCDGMEPDNTDCYQSGDKCVPGQTEKQLRKDQINYIKWMASTAHEMGMSIALKNSLDIIPEVINDVDFGINESCAQWSDDDECGKYRPFVDQNKAVFGIEYKYNGQCSEARADGIMRKYKSENGLKNC